MMVLPVYNNIILISGTDRKVGKTYFACELIRKFSDHSLIAVKISPHWHHIDHTENILFQNEHFLILRETSLDGHKDSSKMLLSGADKVFYIQSKDEYLQMAFDHLDHRYIKGGAVICESAALRKFIKPAAHFRITDSLDEMKGNTLTNIPPADYLLAGNQLEFDRYLNRIQLVDGQWTIL